MKHDKIIFLDIDGPMIPGTQILIDHKSSHNRIFPTTTIAVINEVCKRTGAKIVFNTTHNNSFENVDDIEIAIVKHGLLSDYIHSTDCKTRYPSLRRSDAIQDWLSRHSEVEDDWVAVDDVVCAEPEHMILINGSSGIDVNDANQIINILGGDMILIFL